MPARACRDEGRLDKGCLGEGCFGEGRLGEGCPDEGRQQHTGLCRKLPGRVQELYEKKGRKLKT